MGRRRGGFSCAILAGGEGSRLRAEKALLPLGGRYLVEVLVDRLRPLFSELLLVVKSPHSPLRALRGEGIRMVTDVLTDRGPLGGIHGALHHAAFPHCFVIGCDMPFPSPSLIARLLELAEGREAVVPRRGEFIEPLFAVYARDLAIPMEEALREGRLKVHEFLDRSGVLYLEEGEIARFDPEFLSFFNVNTPEDLRRAAEIEARRGSGGLTPAC